MPMGIDTLDLKYTWLVREWSLIGMPARVYTGDHGYVLLWIQVSFTVRMLPSRIVVAWDRLPVLIRIRVRGGRLWRGCPECTTLSRLLCPWIVLHVGRGRDRTVPASLTRMRVFLIVRVATGSRTSYIGILPRPTTSSWVRLGATVLARSSWIYRSGRQSSFALIIRLRIIVRIILRMLEYLSRLCAARR